MQEKKYSVFGVGLFWLDAAACLFSILLTYLIFDQSLGLVPRYATNDWTKYWLFTALAYYFSFVFSAPTVNIFGRGRKREWVVALKLAGFFAFVQAGLMLLGDCRLMESRYLYCGSIIFYFFFVFGAHILYRDYYKKRYTVGKNAVQVGIVTTKMRAGALLETLKEANVGIIQHIAILEEKEPAFVGASQKEENGEARDFTLDGVPTTTEFEQFLIWTRTHSVDEIYIDVPGDMSLTLQPFIEEMEDMGVVVHYSLTNLEPYIEDDRGFLKNSYTIIGNRPMATFSASSAVFDYQQMALKRLIDFFGGLVGSLISLPVILITAIPLLIESPGPLIFKQKRVGRNGRIFTMYKLRSMYADAEERKKELMEQNEMNGLMFKVSDDPRITKVGKFIRKTSIDELPQFWNVLRGDMSLVGTRPPTLDEYAQYKSRHKRRLSMKPGITGMWQVSGRSDINDFEDVVRLDLKYIDNWSVWMDIRIIFQTVFAVLKSRGAK